MKSMMLGFILLLVVVLTCPVYAQGSGPHPPITPDNAVQLTRLAMLGRGWINQIAWSPDGTTLAVASSAGVWLHDTADLDAAPRFLATRADTWSVAFSPDGRWLATGGRDMSVRVWAMAAINRDIAAAEPLYELLCQSGDWWKGIESLAFSPTGMLLACASDGVMLWDVESGKNLAVLSGEADFWGDTHVAFSPDGNTLATTGTSGKTQAASRRAGMVRQWDVETGALVSSWQLTDGDAVGKDVAYSADGTLLAVSGSEVEVWDTAAGTLRYTLENTSGTRSIAFSPDGTMLVTAGYDLALWDVATGGLLAEPAFDTGEFAGCFEGEVWMPCPEFDDVLSAAISPDGNTLAAANAAGQVAFWNIPSGARMATLSGYNFGGAERGGASSDTISMEHFAFSPDGHTLAAGASGYITSGGWVELWDIEQAAMRGYLAGYGSMSGLAYSPDGTLLATASPMSGVRVWDTSTNTVRHVLMEYGEAVSNLVFSPEGTRLAAGMVYGEIHLWDAATGEPVAVLEGHAEYMTGIAFSPDGTLLASGDADGLVRVWDVNRSALLSMLEGHTGRVNDVAFSPVPSPGEAGGMLLASADGLDAGTIRLWTVQNNGSAVEQPVLMTTAERVLSVAFSPYGTVLACGMGDGTVQLWNAATGAPLVTLAGHPSASRMKVLFSPDGTLLAAGGGDGTIWLWSVPN